MNSAMIKKLKAKDWYFNRVPIFIFTMLGVILLAVVRFGGETKLFAAYILYFTVALVTESKRCAESCAFLCKHASEIFCKNGRNPLAGFPRYFRQNRLCPVEVRLSLPEIESQGNGVTEL
jgi:hypothetical protein